MSQPKKWIRQEIESLDPHKDYVRIWRLSTSYGLNDFMQNLIYALTFTNFVVNESLAEPIWREDGGKVIERSTHRVEQTGTSNAIWWFYGPHDERTKESVTAINNLHAYWAKTYSGNFSDNDVYIYVLAFTAITIHRLRLQCGLPGLPENEQIAAHLFWREMSKLFTAENNTPLHGFPEDFAGLVKFCENFENTPRPHTERGNLVASAIYDQFVFRYFPQEMYWLGHQLIRSLALPTTLATYKIDPPLPMSKEVLPKILGLIFWYQETQLDDPTESYIEKREHMSPEEKAKLKDEIRTLDKAFTPGFIEKYKDDPNWAGCPFHKALGAFVPKGDGPPSEHVHSMEAQAAVIEKA